MAKDALFELRRRTFDTPRFKGIEFIESEAKSILNHVPGNRLPFNWTINPYRGCSHSCSYCTSPDTPILMADGRISEIGNLVVGDRVYGTEFDGKYRRYVITDVLDKWTSVKRAFRITLEDRTELIASGDHRFLSDRGWKHVIGAEHGPLQRPFLTVNNKLIGTGRFARRPKEDADYRRGYLTGMIRGDAHLRSEAYKTPAGNRVSPSCRLALVDREALMRSKKYLLAIGVTTREFVFQQAVGAYRQVDAIITGAAGARVVGEHIEWLDRPSLSWCRGFLAGIFDAEGSCSRGILRISNSDPEILARIGSSLRRLNFFYVQETPKPNRVACIRLLGGLRERQRFFHAVDPAITRKRSIEGMALKSDARLGIESIEDLGIEIPMVDITTGTGDFIANGVVSHNCFARVTHTFLDMNAGSDFDSKIVVKVNAPELLRKELRAKRWKGELVAMGTSTDPYQRAEGRYELMPKIIQALTEVRNPFSILTKGTLILRDLDLLVEAAAVTDVTTSFSIGTFDEEVWAKSEPGTPHPRNRMAAVKRLNEAGVPCGVLVAPILPGLSDSQDQLKEVIDGALDAGATHIYPILLHLRPVVREEYLGWLQDTYPELIGTYEELYRGRIYASSADKAALDKKFKAAMAGRKTVAPRPRPKRPPRARAEIERLNNQQLTLI